MEDEAEAKAEVATKEQSEGIIKKRKWKRQRRRGDRGNCEYGS